MTRSPESLRPWLLLTATRGLGPCRMIRLIQTFGSPQAVLAATVDELTVKGELPPSVARALVAPPSAETLTRIDRELHAVATGRFAILTIGDPSYPRQLHAIPDPPPLLYMTGHLEEADADAMAIVGSRRGTTAGRAFTRQLSEELAALGLTIVSGMARGIDAAAHQGALAASGRTIAVLGCGIDKTYPPEHRALRERIEEHGAILSEFPSGTPPNGYHFPQRNRVISGLSLGVIVAEATIRSGSMITAHHACEQNRDVFAVPGAPTNALSRGPHHLIKQGAKLVETVEDVLEEILPRTSASIRERLAARESSAQPAPPALEEAEAELFNLITLEPVTLETLLSRSSAPLAEVMSILLSLEMKGLIKQQPGPQYSRTTFRYEPETD